jgi:hypothetical protein
MKHLLCFLSALVLSGWALGVSAQEVWAYQVVGRDNQPRLVLKPPVDLTFPPPGVPLPIVMGNATTGVALTPREEAARRNAPHLIIMLIPAQIADRTRMSMP